MMNKITYNLVYNRKKSLNKRGLALVQVEAYLNGKKKVFFDKGLFAPRTMGYWKAIGQKTS